MAGPASKRTSGWNLLDWIVAIFVIVLVAGLLTASIHTLAPNSGLALAIHNAGVAVARFLQLIAAFFTFLASLFSQL